MTSKLTIEQAKRLRNDFECWQQDYDPKDDKEQYDMFGRGIVAMDMLIAGMYQEPVAYAVSNDFWNQGNHKQHIDGKQCDLFFPDDVSHGEKFEPDDYDYVFPLYRHAQPAVDSDFIPKNLDKALGVVGMALPESKEEFNFQTERWIQRLIDRVIRYADEFQEQSTPVVPDEVTAEDCPALVKYDVTEVDEAWARGFNACRAAMLAATPQEVGDA